MTDESSQNDNSTKEEKAPAKPLKMVFTCVRKNHHGGFCSVIFAFKDIDNLCPYNPDSELKLGYMAKKDADLFTQWQDYEFSVTLPEPVKAQVSDG
jgi:hypothetical protein